jgi:hypothetical protein
MKRCVYSISICLCLTTLLATSLDASAETKTAKKAPVVDASKTTMLAKADSATTLADDDGVMPNIDKSITYNYQCELDGSFTLYTHQDDDNRAALRWKNKLYGLKRIPTTTGADRFENKKAGIVWISIPAKSMLFDSIRGEQLANECKVASTTTALQ